MKNNLPANKKASSAKKWLLLLAEIAGTVAAFAIYRLAANLSLGFVFWVYVVIATALAMTYLIYNRGLSRRGVTIEMLPDTMTAAEKEEFIADAERRMKRSKWMLALLIPFLFTFLFDAVELFLLDGFLRLIG
jgi:predicted cobalt transporter CbtA